MVQEAGKMVLRRQSELLETRSFLTLSELEEVTKDEGQTLVNLADWLGVEAGAEVLIWSLRPIPLTRRSVRRCSHFPGLPMNWSRSRHTENRSTLYDLQIRFRIFGPLAPAAVQSGRGVREEEGEEEAELHAEDLQGKCDWLVVTGPL